jgi:hypothetical protein
MIKNIEKGETLLIRGPTRVTLLSGKLDVFGKIILPIKESSTSKTAEFEDDNIIIIPGANNYPLFALEKSELEIYTASEENIEKIKEN